VFANAGVAKYAPFGTITEEFYDSIFNINVKGLLFTVQKIASAAVGWRLCHLECVRRRQQRVLVE
jgi:NAD(P)-dependent dehydrogenase (short-subunit alcohol dehydrogenase family)